MFHSTVVLFVIAINSMIFTGQVYTVKIFESMDLPTLEVGKAVKLTWIIKYGKDEKKRFSELHLKKGLNESFIKIASYADKLSSEGQTLLGKKADLTSITPYEVTVNFKQLEYLDDFHFMCLAVGITMSRTFREANKTLSVIDVKGGPTICGNSIIKDKLVVPTGDSSFTVTFCGNPRPKLSYAFMGKTIEVLGIEVDIAKRMYRYKIDMKKIDSNHCGQTIRFQISGYGNMVKESTVIVKYNPSMIKKFEYTKVIGQNCTTIKITDEYNPKCPLKYKIEIYDKNEISAMIKKNPFIIDSLFFKICRQDFFNMGEFATVTAIWKHDSFNEEYLGTPSDFVKVRHTFLNNGSENEKKRTSKSLIFVILLVLGIFIIVMIIVIVLIYKYKQNDKRDGSRSPRSGSEVLMKKGPEEKTEGVQSSTTNSQYPQYEEIKLPENYELNNSQPLPSSLYSDLWEGNRWAAIPPPLYSKLLEVDERASSKPVLKTESNYANAKDVDYYNNKHIVYPERYQERKDVFDPVDYSDSDDNICNHGVSPGKLFKSPFGNNKK